METTPYGSVITREITTESLSCFEAMSLGSGWRYLTSSDDRKCHGVWLNEQQRSLLEYCEGDVIHIDAPDEFILSLEVQVQVEFCNANR